MDDPIQIPATVFVEVTRECLRDMRANLIFQLGGRGHVIDMAVNSQGGEQALRRIDALPGGLSVNFLGQLVPWSMPPPDQITDKDVLAMLRRSPGELMRSVLQDGVQEALAKRRPDFHYIQMFLFHKPQPYLQGWRMDLKSGQVWQVPVEVIGTPDWEW